jgi:hypothetical protein
MSSALNKILDLVWEFTPTAMGFIFLPLSSLASWLLMSMALYHLAPVRRITAVLGLPAKSVAEEVTWFLSGVVGAVGQLTWLITTAEQPGLRMGQKDIPDVEFIGLPVRIATTWLVMVVTVLPTGLMLGVVYGAAEAWNRKEVKKE